MIEINLNPGASRKTKGRGAGFSLAGAMGGDRPSLVKDPFLLAAIVSLLVAGGTVGTMHMTQSVLPERAATAIRGVPGVARATPIVYVPAMLELGERRSLVYLIGEDTAERTLPLVSGRRARAGEIVVDESLASPLGAAPGATVTSLGRRFRVVGRIAGTASIASSFRLHRKLAPGASVERTLRMLHEELWEATGGQRAMTMSAVCLAGGFFFAEMVIGPMWAIPMDIAPKYSGTASGLMNTGSALAAILSPVVAGALVDMTGDRQLPFTVAIGVLMLGALTTFLMRPEKQFTDEAHVSPKPRTQPAE